MTHRNDFDLCAALGFRDALKHASRLRDVIPARVTERAIKEARAARINAEHRARAYPVAVVELQAALRRVAELEAKLGME